MYTTRNSDSLELRSSETSDGSIHKLLEFEDKFRDPDVKETLVSKWQKTVSGRKENFSLKNTCLSFFPIVKTFQHYNVKEDLPNDVIAGVTAGVMMIPQGMAFAALSTLPPIVGLYISFFASLTYFLLGTGKQLSWGCIAILSLMMASILDKYDEKMSTGGSIMCRNESERNNFSTFYGNFSLSLNRSGAFNKGPRRVMQESEVNSDQMSKRLEVASAVSMVAGFILIAASRIGLSRITSLMSNSLITGFTVGISFHVVTSQLKGVLGLSIPRYTGYASIIKTWISILSKLPETNLATLIISTCSMFIIYVVKRFINEKYKKQMRIPIPIELFIVIIATLISNYAKFHQKYEVKVVEDVPMGIPSPRFPDLSLARDYIGDGVIIIVIAYAQTLAMAKTMGLKHNYVVDANQEMLACGVVSVVCGLFSGYISASSVSRTVVQDGAGGKTQIASLFASGMVLLVIVLVGRYFYYLPMCVLSSIIIINLRTMFMKLLFINQEWKKSKYDCAVWLFACFSTVILNADIGLLASILFSLFLIILRSMLTPVVEAGKIQTGALAMQLRSIDKYSSAKTVQQVKILKIRTPLYYVNADIFPTNVFDKTGINPTIINKKAASLVIPDTEKGNLKNGAVSETDKDCSIKVEMLSDDGKEIEALSLQVVVLDASEVAFVDLMGIEALQFVIREFSHIGIKVLLTGISEGVIPMLQSTGFCKKNGDLLYLTVESALASLDL
ncbi:sulfate transporter-like [Plakobranchus ocellatus]|uniref:Sulfate transporter-like n=1 Tax=Plakobranchus ocellatus TaxID=259542 RepID=A0AAV4BWU6_9GAST|nr:sulfate transporter-like [Plakobranchus ocellatus]